MTLPKKMLLKLCFTFMNILRTNRPSTAMKLKDTLSTLSTQGLLRVKGKPQTETAHHQTATLRRHKCLTFKQYSSVTSFLDMATQ